MVLGQGKYKYRRVENWARIPPYFQYKSTPEAKYRYPLGITGDARNGTIYVTFRNTAHPVVMFDRDGNFSYCWGEREITYPHDITFGPDGLLYIPDIYLHTVEKFTPTGEPRGFIGQGRGIPGVTFIRQPFNMPTGVGFAPSGEMYVTDGYGNSLVHKFSADGKLLKTWGGPGNGPGQFNIPHAVIVDRKGAVYVSDRLNERIQKFTADGELIDIWKNVFFPMDIIMDRENDIIYTLECTDYVGWPERLPGASRITVRDLKGKILGEFGGRESEGKGGVLEIGHAIWVDANGDIYEVEIFSNTRLQKFERVK